MKKLIYNLFTLALTLVILSGCTSEGDPLIKPIKDGINSQNYTVALAWADTAIAKDPMNGTAYYYKGYAYSKMVTSEMNPENRTMTYEKMRAALDKAEELYATAEEPTAESRNIVPLTLEAWSREHNEGIQYATNDSLMGTVEDPLGVSIAHLVNATTINPDSTLSFDVLAQIYYMDSNYEGAANAMRTTIDLKNPGEASEYDRLSSYLTLQGKTEASVAALEEGLELYPDSTSLVQKIADGYFKVGETEKGLSVMRELINSDPTNARYHLVKGSNVYQRVLNLTDVEDKTDDVKEEIKMLTDVAEEALLRSAELDDTNPITFNTLGVLYQNKSADLFDMRNNTLDNDEADRFDALAKEEATRAMVNYEKAVELDPENTQYWATLFRIYTTLDMREKAEEAMNKAGM